METFEKLVTQDIQKIRSESTQGGFNINSNLSKEEFLALSSLKDNKDIIIKPADKGGGIVILNKTDNIAEIFRQLGDGSTYETLKSDPTKRLLNNLNILLTKYMNKTTITSDEKILCW